MTDSSRRRFYEKSILVNEITEANNILREINGKVDDLYNEHPVGGWSIRAKSGTSDRNVHVKALVKACLDHIMPIAELVTSLNRSVRESAYDSPALIKAYYSMEFAVELYADALEYVMLGETLSRDGLFPTPDLIFAADVAATAATMYRDGVAEEHISEYVDESLFANRNLAKVAAANVTSRGDGNTAGPATSSLVPHQVSEAPKQEPLGDRFAPLEIVTDYFGKECIVAYPNRSGKKLVVAYPSIGFEMEPSEDFDHLTPRLYAHPQGKHVTIEEYADYLVIHDNEVKIATFWGDSWSGVHKHENEKFQNRGVQIVCKVQRDNHWDSEEDGPQWDRVNLNGAPFTF